MARPCEPGGDILGVAVEEAAAVRVGDDVDHLWQVDHHQPPVVDEQVVGGQVAVREADVRQCCHGLDELAPEACEFGWPGAGLAEAGRAGAVRVADELKQDLCPQDLHRIGDRHAGVVKLHEGVELRVRPLAGDRLPPEATAVRDRPVDPALADPAAFQVAGIAVELPVRCVPVALGGEQAGVVRPRHATADEKYVGFLAGLEDAKLVVNRREVGHQPLRMRSGAALRRR
jgi:hypothetical protein